MVTTAAQSTLRALGFLIGISLQVSVCQLVVACPGLAFNIKRTVPGTLPLYGIALRELDSSKDFADIM